MAIEVRSYECAVLIERLRPLVTHEDYGVVTYKELNCIINPPMPQTRTLDVQRGKGSGYLTTAIRTVKRETNRLLGRKRGEGVKLMTIEEQAAYPDDAMKRVKRLAARKQDDLQKVQFEKLPKPDQIRHLTASSVLGAVGMFMKKTSLKRISQACDATQQKINFLGTLSLFSNGSETTDSGQA